MEILISVKFCARCGEDHGSLKFKPFTNKVTHHINTKDIEATHWAMCPTLQEPIMMVMVIEDELV